VRGWLFARNLPLLFYILFSIDVQFLRVTRLAHRLSRGVQHRALTPIQQYHCPAPGQVVILMQPWLFIRQTISL
jgi:hypothetical protein